jgi:hypothetical protein
LQRINRKLSQEQEKIARCRESSRAFDALGRFYRLDTHRNSITARGVDLEDLGRELGVLAQWEAIDQ